MADSVTRLTLVGGVNNQFLYNSSGDIAGSATLRNASGRILLDPLGSLSDDTFSSSQIKYGIVRSCPGYGFPPPFSETTQVDPGVFTATGLSFAFRAFPYRMYGSIKVFANNPIGLSFTDDGLGGTYNVAASFDAPIGGCDGYRIIIDEDDVNLFYSDKAFEITASGTATDGFEYDGGISLVTIISDVSTSPTFLTELAQRITGRLMVDEFGSMTDDKRTSLQVGGDGNAHFFPGNWGSGIIQRQQFGDPYHQFVNIYGAGYGFYTYPGTNDPMQFGSNFDGAFSIPRAVGMILQPDNSNPTQFQLVIGKNISTSDVDFTTALKVIGDMCLTTKIVDASNQTAIDIANGNIQNSGGNIVVNYAGQTLVHDGASNELTWNDSGILIRQTIYSYKGKTTVDNGVPSELANADLTAQTAAKAATTIYAVPSTGAGMYRISWVATITTAGLISSVLGGTNGFQIVFTSPTDSVVKTSIVGNSITSTANTTGTTIGGTLIAYCKASTNLQYKFDYTSAGATPMAYELHVKVEAM